MFRPRNAASCGSPSQRVFGKYSREASDAEENGVTIKSNQREENPGDAQQLNTPLRR